MSDKKPEIKKAIANSNNKESEVLTTLKLLRNNIESIESRLEESEKKNDLETQVRYILFNDELGTIYEALKTSENKLCEAYIDEGMYEEA